MTNQQTPPPNKEAETLETDDDSGIGGDEPFCKHGNLLWSEHCEECIAESWALSDAITKAAIREGDRVYQSSTSQATHDIKASTLAPEGAARPKIS